MKTHVFTEQDFTLYRKEIWRLVEMLGLTEWRIRIEHDQIGESVSAQVQYNSRSKSALFRLTKVLDGDFGWEIDPERLALHEVLHLLLADYCWVAAKAHDDLADVVVSHEHELINRLMRCITGGS